LFGKEVISSKELTKINLYKPLRMVSARPRNKQEMKNEKVSLISGTVLIVALLFVLISVVSAQSDQSAVIKCTADIVADEWKDGVYWRGPVSGCSLEGTVQFHENPDRDFTPNGTMAHFYELFTFYPDSGGYISGYNNGIWNFRNFNFRAQGFVTDASDEWAHLIGAKYHEMGTTTDPGPDFALPIVATGTNSTIVPAK
jgi:hypothetical protein